MDLGLRDRRALVTAASRGLGKACAAVLAAEGARVFVSSRGTDELGRAAREIGAAGHRAADVSSAGEVAALVEAAVTVLGGLDILVCNAGGPPPGGFEAIDEEGWRKGFDLTLMSAVRLIREALPHLRRSGAGRIVIITSISGRQPIPGLILSNAFRPAVTGMAKTLSQEVGPDGVTVNCIAPEGVLTDRVRSLRSLLAQSHGRSTDDELRSYADRLPVRRLGTPEEVGAACAFLCSAQAGFITGSTLGLDGGGVVGIH